ncbi:ImpA-related N- family protein [Salmonella enterica subsp. enterica]|nr:ImpA-related N- family protein [Salmonella enterica subsp. enterica]
MHSIHSCLPAKAHPQNLLKMRRWRASNALAALLDHEGVMADIRGITLSNSAALRLQVRDVERALSAPRPADALAPESVRQQLPTSKPVGHYRWRRFAKRRKAQNACKCGRVRH